METTNLYTTKSVIGLVVVMTLDPRFQNLTLSLEELPKFRLYVIGRLILISFRLDEIETARFRV